MVTTVVRCTIAEPDGTPLGSGRVLHLHSTPTEEGITVAVDRPNQLIRRCMLDGLRGVSVVVEGAPSRPALVEHLLFDPSIGRVCVLRMLPR